MPTVIVSVKLLPSNQTIQNTFWISLTEIGSSFVLLVKLLYAFGSVYSSSDGDGDH